MRMPPESSPPRAGSRLFAIVLFASVLVSAPPALAWIPGATNYVFTPAGTIFSSAAIGTNGIVYVGTKNHDSPYLYAFTPLGTTQHVWTLAGRTYAPPTIGPDGTIYVGCESNLVYALNPDGTTQRTWTTGTRITCNAAIARDGTIYVAGYNDRTLYSLNPDGTTNGAWPIASSGYMQPSPVLTTNDDVLMLCGTYLYLMNPDGTTQRMWTVGTGSYSTPTIGSDGTIYVGALDSRLYAFNPDGTTQRTWTTRKSINYSSVAIGTNGILYVGDTGGNLYGFDPAGTTQHIWTADDDIYSSPSVAEDGTIYVGSNYGTNDPAWDPNFYAFNPDGTTDIVWRLDAGSGSSARIQASPAISSDGTVYIGSYDEDAFFALPGTGSRLAHSAWPKYGQNQFNTGRLPYCDVAPDNGPSTGGVVVLISSQMLGSGSDISDVTFDGVSAAILGQGIGWVRVRAPAGPAGLTDVAVDSTSVGVTRALDGYLYNGPGVIGIDVMDGWTEVAAMPAARKYVGGDVLGGFLYAVGGADTLDADSTNVYRFDGSAWTEVAGLPDLRSHMGVATYSNLLYAVGGSKSGVAYTNVFVFDGTNWSQASGLPYGRLSPAVVVFDGGLYAIGGWGGGNAKTNVCRFDGTAWTETAGLPSRLYGAAAAAGDDGITLAGGLNAVDAAQTNVYRFDGASWSEMRGLPTNQAYAGAAVLAGLVTVAGGTVSSNVYRYDGTNWVTGQAMPAQRSGFASGVLNGYYYAAGGAGPAGTARANTYRYQGRIFESGVEPDHGPTAGGFSVAIWGSNLCNGSLSDVLDVRLCNVSAAINDATPTQITVSAGAAPPGSGDIRIVSTSFGTTIATNRFTYESADILVLGTNAQAIANGAAPNAARGTDFGMRHAGTSVTHTLILTNSGSTPLTISGWTTNGQPGPVFTVAGISSSVPVGGQAAFTVNYHPLIAGAVTAALVIANNAPGADSSYIVNLRGKAYTLSTYRGPACGGNLVTVTNGALGNGFDIAGVQVNGAAALVVSQGVNWVKFVMPANQAGLATIVTHSPSRGYVPFPDVYFYDPCIRVIASPHGVVVPNGAVILDYGASTSFVITASQYYHIGRVLTNNTEDPAAEGFVRYTSVWNNVTATGLLVAVFDDNLTANTGTPEAWLARFGWTNDFESAATNDADGDLVPTCDEYVTDTIPTNGDSYLRLTGIDAGSVEWAGGLYVPQFLEGSLSGLDGEWDILGIYPPPTVLTNNVAVDADASYQFYRVRTER